MPTNPRTDSGESLTIDKSTFEVKGKDSGKVYGQGKSLPEALALQNQFGTGGTPTVAGRPDLYAVEPTAAEKTSGFGKAFEKVNIADQGDPNMVTPRVATPGELAQKQAGTLPTAAAERAPKQEAPRLGEGEIKAPEITKPKEPTNFADAMRDTLKAGAQSGLDTAMKAPESYDNKVLQQKAVIMAALLGDAVTPEDLRILNPQQQAAIRGGKKSALETALVGLNTIITGRKDLKKEEEEKAMRQFDLFAQSGTDPSQLPQGFLQGLDAKMGLPDGTYESIYKANFASLEAERTSSLLDAQIKISQYLDTIPMGQSISIGGQSYVGTDSGKIEINEKTGDVYSMREDPDSPSGFTISKIGNVGSQEGRELVNRYNEETGNYELWSVDRNNPADSRPVTQGGSGGASSGGVNTYSLQDAFPDGESFSDTSWCLEWIREISADGSLPAAGTMNGIDAKAAWADESIGVKNVQAGDYVLTNEDSEYGHIALITSIQTNPAGQKVAVLAESNYKKGKVTYNRTMVLDENNMAMEGGKIMGFHHSQLKSDYTSQPQPKAFVSESGSGTTPDKPIMVDGKPYNYVNGEFEPINVVKTPEEVEIEEARQEEVLEEERIADLERKLGEKKYNDMLSSIDDIFDSNALDMIAGTTPFTRISNPLQYDALSGSYQDAVGKTSNILTNMSLESLITAKSRGATFGALSDTEMVILSNAASAINKHEKTNVFGDTYYDMNEDSFKKEMNVIKETLKLTKQKYQLTNKPTTESLIEEYGMPAEGEFYAQDNETGEIWIMNEDEFDSSKFSKI